MKKKSGFIFAETIIVLSILSVGLILLYTTFSNVIRKEKVQTTYNQAIDVYNLITIKKYIKAISTTFPGGTAVPRVAGTPRMVNTGQNSLYFRLECNCSDEVNAATNTKYGYYYCSDVFNPIYNNYCSDINNHLGVRDIYIIPNNNVRAAINQIISDGEKIDDDCSGEACTVNVSGKTFSVPRYELGSNISGVPRVIHYTLEEYLNTLSELKSSNPAEIWSNDYIIIGEFYRKEGLYYASLRYED